MRSDSRITSPMARRVGRSLRPRWWRPEAATRSATSTGRRARGRWDVASGLKKQAQIDELIAFFRARWGKAYGFRFKDWTDYKATGQFHGTGDGAIKTFQLVKHYP